MSELVELVITVHKSAVDVVENRLKLSGYSFERRAPQQPQSAISVPDGCILVPTQKYIDLQMFRLGIGSGQAGVTMEEKEEAEWEAKYRAAAIDESIKIAERLSIAQPVAVPSEPVNRIHERFQRADAALDHIFKMRVVGEVHQYAAKARYQLEQIYKAAIAAPSPAVVSGEAVKDQVGWLVEDSHLGGVIQYRTMDQEGIHWTTDANKAIRFARREDAEMFAAGDEDAWHVVGHMWCDVPAAQPDKKEKHEP